MPSSHDARVDDSMLAWRAKLVAAQRPSLFDRGQFYVPWEDIMRITDPDNVTEEALELLGVKEGKNEYAKLVQGRERILCTLLYSYLTHMFLPIGHGPRRCRDEDLPVECSFKNGSIAVMGDGVFANTFSGCEPFEIYDFYDSQWRFYVPVLKWSPWYTVAEYLDPLYHPRTVFPFDSETLPKTTPFSRVWKVKIHRSHVVDGPYFMDYRFRAWMNDLVALKESVINVNGLRVDAEVQEAPNERTTHFSLSSPKVRVLLGSFRLHLTELYWAFRRQNTHYMIFPWARGGSLSDFWHKKDPKRFTATELNQWIEQNIIGLLGVIHALHKFGCSHGDLKPGNILVFSKQKNPKNPDRRHYSYKFPWAKNDATSTISLPRELGILKIADFGTARLNSNATTARTRDANALTGAQRYAPPEFNRNELKNNSPRSRLYDVWSIGCILLEFITWACSGRNSVRRFSSRLEEPHPGRFWTIGENRQKTLHPSVRHQFRKLKTRLEGTGTVNERLNTELREYLLQLLKAVRTQMLVVNVNKTIFRKESEDSCTDDEESWLEGMGDLEHLDYEGISSPSSSEGTDDEQSGLEGIDDEGSSSGSSSEGTDDEGSSSEGTDDEGSSSEGTRTMYRATAETLHLQFLSRSKAGRRESVEEEDLSPLPRPSVPSSKEFQATLANRPKRASLARGDSEE